MKKSGYLACYHIYFIFLMVILAVVISGTIFLSMLITMTTPAGEVKRSNWPQVFAKAFETQIIFVEDGVEVKQSGLELLQANHIGLQILDATGKEIYGFQRPERAKADYSLPELLSLSQEESGQEEILFVQNMRHKGKEYIYILYMPVKINKVTMYLNGNVFTNGKTVCLYIIGVLSFVIMLAGILYGLWISKIISHITLYIRDISKRQYVKVEKQGVFKEIYTGLNTLDETIRESDKARLKTETMRREWIANITHDLKTPLSPIKGYAEIMQNDNEAAYKNHKKYAGIMLKNALYMQQLIDDLKLTYQLESDMLPMAVQKQNIVSFLRELIIDILNRPEYEGRLMEFDSSTEQLFAVFDTKLLTRAFQNLIINAFVHGDEETEIKVQLKTKDKRVQISITDNGKGMTKEELERVFEHYYRGMNTQQKGEGTGLGLAIAKNIIELHKGTITVSSIPEMGTTFLITLDIT